MRTDREAFIANEKIEARFGWDAFPRQRSMGLIGGLLAESTSVDCDACAVFCDKNGKPISSQEKETCLSYMNDSMFDGAAHHNGDNTTGEGADDEIISLDLKAIPAEVGAIIFTLDLFKERKKSRLGKIQNTFVRITRQSDSEEIGRYDFRNLGNDKKMVVCGLLKRQNSDWIFIPPQEETPNVNSMNEFISAL